jgi:HEAT repeat protein
VTPDERQLVLRLVTSPNHPAQIGKDEFLRQIGATSGVELGIVLLRDAVQRQDSYDVELALIVGFSFGFTEDHLPMLVPLALSDWHHSHEDVVGAFRILPTPMSVPALTHLATHVPEYLIFDDARALSVKAIWALGAISDSTAQQSLQSLAHSDVKIVSLNAKAQLERKRENEY